MANAQSRSPRTGPDNYPNTTEESLAVRAARVKNGDGDTSPNLALFDTPRARNSWRDGNLVVDPQTSKAAAESVTPRTVSRIQRAILSTLTTAREPRSDEQICEALAWLKVSESGIRSRRAELVRKGLIEVADADGLTKHSRACRRYRVAERGGS